MVINTLAPPSASWRYQGREDVTTALLFMHAGSNTDAIAAELTARDVEVIQGVERALLALCAANATLRDFQPLNNERRNHGTGTNPGLPWFGAALTDPNRFSRDLAGIVRAHFISPATARRRRALFVTEPFWERENLHEFARFMTFDSPRTLLMPVLEPRADAVMYFAKATGWSPDACRQSIEILENQTLHLLDAFPEQTFVWDRGIGPEGLDAVFPAQFEVM